ncbi:MAG: DUF5011 domain-containing protein [Candidatus Hydrogenedens sp.]|jgi:hypothetical protein|nr:DUF5011 domain-containing protein [Candidatus Hydrogenedens sp.]
MDYKVSKKTRGSARRLLLGICCAFLVLSALPAAAQITFDSESYGEVNEREQGSFERGWDHTIGNHNNRVLVVSIASNRWNTATAAPEWVRFNGVNLELAILAMDEGNTSNYRPNATIWYMLNPPVGTFQLRVRYAKQSDGGARQIGMQMLARATSWHGVRQEEPEIIKSAGRSTAADLSLHPAEDGCVVISAMAASEGRSKDDDDRTRSAVRMDTNNTERLNYEIKKDVGLGGSRKERRLLAGCLTHVQDTRFNQNLGFTISAQSYWNQAAVAFKPIVHTVDFVANPAIGGSVPGSSATIRDTVGVLPFTVTPGGDYNLTGSPTTTSGTVTGSGTSWSLTNVKANATVTANFTLKPGTLKVNLTGPAAARWSIDGSNWNASGASLSLPPTEYTLTFNTQTGLTTPDSQQVTVTPAGSHSAAGIYKANITYAVAANGSITGSASQAVNYGSNSAPVTAKANAGFAFTSWDDGNTNATRSDAALAHKTYTASFTGIFHNVDSEISTETPAEDNPAGGTVFGLSDSIQDTIGTIPFTVELNPGYVFDVAPTASNGTIVAGTAPNYTLSGVTADTVVTVKFSNTQPVISVSPVEIPLECGGNGYTEAFARAGIRVTDAEDGAINVQYVTVTPSVEFPFTEKGTYTITYTVSDKAGLAAEPVIRTITIQDTQGPVITLNGGNDPVTVECDQTATYVDPGATALDACEGDVEVTASGSVNMAQPDTYEITYTAKDSGDRETTATRIITVEDTEAPVLALNGQEIVNIPEGTNYDDPGATASDQCDGGVSVTATGTVDTSVPGTYTLYYNHTDSSGNAAEEITRSVKVVSVENPSVMSVEVETEFTVIVTWNKEISSMAEALVADNYTVSGNGAGTLSANPTSVEGVDADSVRLIWTDAGEMLNGRSIIITIDSAFEDDYGKGIDGAQGAHSSGGIGIPPIVTLNGDAEMTLQCGLDIYEELGATAVDNVDVSVEVVISGEVDTSVTDEYIITYTATDNAGNVGTAVRTVTVEDTTAPEIELPGDDDPLEVPCGLPFTAPPLNAWDACDGDVSGKVTVGGDVVDTSVVGAVYTITYDMTDDAGNVADTVSRTVTVVDNEGPEIFITGDNPLILDGAEEYTEYGAVAIDACGNVDYTDDIIIESNVNPLVKGSYEVTYTVTDSSENPSTATRVVEVKRETCKLLFVIEITPNPAVPGEAVTMVAKALGGSCWVGNLHYLWEKRGANKDDGFEAILGAGDSDTFVISSVGFDDAGEYRCSVSDAMAESAVSPVVTLNVGSGIPAVGGVGLAFAAAALLAAATAALKKRD